MTQDLTDRLQRKAGNNLFIVVGCGADIDSPAEKGRGELQLGIVLSLSVGSEKMRAGRISFSGIIKARRQRHDRTGAS
jgi:predicted membrane GTPase involved in stress response